MSEGLLSNTLGPYSERSFVYSSEEETSKESMFTRWFFKMGFRSTCVGRNIKLFALDNCRNLLSTLQGLKTDREEQEKSEMSMRDSTRFRAQFELNSQLLLWNPLEY